LGVRWSRLAKCQRKHLERKEPHKSQPPREPRAAPNHGPPPHTPPPYHPPPHLPVPRGEKTRGNKSTRLIKRVGAKNRSDMDRTEHYRSVSFRGESGIWSGAERTKLGTLFFEGC